LYLIGNDLVLTDSVIIEDFSLWTEEGTYVVNKINNIYGHGDDVYGSNDGLGLVPNGTSNVTALPTFTSTFTITASPTGWVEPSFPTWAIASTGYGSMLHLNFFLRLSLVVLTCL
jgi:rhamnogalacturonan hydrolase